MISEKVPITVIGGGYNYNYVDALVTETYPRWDNTYVKFVNDDTDVRMYIDYPFDADSPVLKPSKCSIALVEEPYFAVPEFANFIYHHSHLFDIVFTNQQSLLGLGKPNIRYYPGGGGTNIFPKDRVIYDKTKLICAVFSQKNFAEGHKFRQQIRNDPYFAPYVDFVNSVPYVSDSYKDKASLLRPYAFNIAIENEFNTRFADKIHDCFLTGCIPIYKGNKRLGDYFNMGGVITFDTIDELKRLVRLISMIGLTWYRGHADAVNDNFNRAQRLTSLGDILWTHGLEDVLKQKGVI